MPSNPLFNIARAEVVAAPAAPAPVPPGAVGAPPPIPEPPPTPPPAGAVGVITASQSAITFAGAPAAVTLVSKVLAAAVPSLAGSKPLAIGLSLAIGMVIYWQSAPISGTLKEKISGFIFALVNSFAIAAATLGIAAAG